MNSKQSFDELLENELRKPLDIELPDGFSAQIVEKIEARNEILSFRTNWVLNGAIGGFVMLAVFCLLVFVPEDLKKQMIQILLFAIPVGVLIGIFQYLDHRYVRNRMSTS